jgi:hypothetical protein
VPGELLEDPLERGLDRVPLALALPAAEVGPIELQRQQEGVPHEATKNSRIAVQSQAA